MAEASRAAVAKRGLLERLWTFEARLFALAFVFIPNLPYVLLWLFITPRRASAVPLYLLAGAMAIRLPLLVSMALFVLVAGFDAALTIAGVFDLSPMLVADAIRFMPLLDISGSFLYVALVAVLTATIAAMAWMTRRYKVVLADASPLLAAALAGVWMVADLTANFDIGAKFGSVVDGFVEFDSALNRSGIAANATASGPHNILIVMVEGMGAFADPKHTEVMRALLDRPEVRRRYKLSKGTSPYVGSTTGAASRELCG